MRCFFSCLKEGRFNGQVLALGNKRSRRKARRIGAAEEEAFLLGDGNSKPTALRERLDGEVGL